MGVNALNGVQVRKIGFEKVKIFHFCSFKFFERIFLMFMPNKYQPNYPYLKHVSIKRIHLFTIIQLLSLAGLILVKSIESIAILFPVMVFLRLIYYSKRCYFFVLLKDSSNSWYKKTFRFFVYSK